MAGRWQWDTSVSHHDMGNPSGAETREALSALLRHTEDMADPYEAAAILDEASAILGIMPEFVLGWAAVEAALADDRPIVEFTRQAAS